MKKLLLIASLGAVVSTSAFAIEPKPDPVATYVGNDTKGVLSLPAVTVGNSEYSATFTYDNGALTIFGSPVLLSSDNTVTPVASFDIDSGELIIPDVVSHDGSHTTVKYLQGTDDFLTFSNTFIELLATDKVVESRLPFVEAVLRNTEEIRITEEINILKNTLARLTGELRTPEDILIYELIYLTGELRVAEEIIRNTNRISVVLNTLSEEIRLSEEIIRLSEDLSISEEIIRHIEGINIVLKARYDVMILSDAEPRFIVCPPYLPTSAENPGNGALAK